MQQFDKVREQQDTGEHWAKQLRYLHRCKNAVAGSGESLSTLQSNLQFPWEIFCDSVLSRHASWTEWVTQWWKLPCLKKLKRRKTWNSTSSDWNLGKRKCATESMLGETFIWWRGWQWCMPNMWASVCRASSITQTIIINMPLSKACNIMVF